MVDILLVVIPTVSMAPNGLFSHLLPLMMPCIHDKYEGDLTTIIMPNDTMELTVHKHVSCLNSTICSAKENPDE